MNPNPIIIISPDIIIRAESDHLQATFYIPVGDQLVPTTREKYFPDVEDLYALPLKGILTLAKEFHSEIKNK